MVLRHLGALLMSGALVLPCVSHAQALVVEAGESSSSPPSWQSRIWSYFSENTHGTLEMGAMYGRPPFTLASTGALNMVGRGSLQMTLMGVPIISSFDLGSDVSTNGARNSFRVSLDTERLKEQVQLRDAQRLTDALDRRDSLQYALERAGHAPRLDTATSRVRLEQPSVDSIGVDPHGLNMDSLRIQDNPSIGEQPESMLVPSSVTGIEAKAPDVDRNLNGLAAAEMNQQRAEAIVNMDMDRSVGGRFLMGLRRLELGLLTPDGSEFLLNGLSIQGVGSEWASERLFISFDHGRCLDDSWRSVPVSADRLRRLQESLFLLDASAMDPRRLTVLRTGVGLPEATHVHIGVLRGRRSGLAYGAESPSAAGTPEMTNHVVEMDAALTIKANHMARLVIARSMTSADSNESESDSDDVLLGRGSGRFSAYMLHWRTELPKNQAVINLTGRAIGSGFQSMGLAFIRSGTRSLDAAFSKDFGRLRLKAGYRRELRQGSLGTDQVLLDRYRLQSTYRLSKAVSLRASVLPMSVKGQEQSVIDQRVLVTQAGISFRWRKKKTQYVLLGDCSRFNQVLLTEPTGSTATWYGNVGAELQGGRLRASLNYAALHEPGDSSPSAGSLSLECAYKLRNGVEIGTGTVVDPSALGNVGGRISYRQPLYKGLHLTLGAERWQDRQIFQSQDLGNAELGLYTCSVLIGYSW